MHLVQEDTDRRCHSDSKACVIDIETYVAGRLAMTRTERIAQF